MTLVVQQEQEGKDDATDNEKIMVVVQNHPGWGGLPLSPTGEEQ